jgi:hypothetical protein
VSTSTPEHKNVHTGRHTSPKKSAAADHRVQVAAAKLRVALDERLGRPTPPKTKALAKENF